MKNLIKNIHSQRGATMIEYALLAALISVVAIAAITAVGGDVKAVFEAIRDAISV